MYWSNLIYNEFCRPDANQSYEYVLIWMLLQNCLFYSRGEFMKSLRHGYGSDNGYFPGMKFEGM